MNKVTVTAPGRVDLVAGPTDWCGMNTLNMAINLRAKAVVEKLADPELVRITINGKTVEYKEPKYDGQDFDLFKAVIELTELKGFAVNYETEIPRGSGLGGSAPLTVSTVYGLNKLFAQGWNKYYMTELANRAETLKLQTVQGTQDQYAAMFGGLLFMDFRGKVCQRGQYSKPIEQEPYAVVERLDEYAPNLYITIAVPEIKRVKSDETNGSLSERYLDGEEKIVETMELMAINGQEGKRAIVNGEREKLFDCINQDNEYMTIFGMVAEENKEIVSIAKKAGAAAGRVCGAGRAAVALYARSQNDRQKVYDALKGEVKEIFQVERDEGARYE